MSKKYTVLVVDDEPDNLLLLERVLRREYNVFSASSGPEALDVLDNMAVDMIISDQRMPQMTGAELLGQAYMRNPDQIRLLLTAYSDVKDIISAINSGHIYQYLAKPWDPDELKLVVRRALEAYQLTLDNKRMLADYRNDEAMLLSAFSNLVAKLEERAPHLVGHAHRTKEYATLIARELRLFGEEMFQLEAAAYLHQLGLLVLPDRLLNTPFDQLDADAQQQLANHPLLAEELLMPLPFFLKAMPLLELVRERHDGSGPRGLAGDEIPLLARILSVAATFDALVQGVPGVSGLAFAEAREALAARQGSELDPTLVARFLEVIGDNAEAIACPK
ncbi:MAG TPA: HD domain-containing phosphohydrolase [Oscillatoriaceae cyanobacterium]